jgi:hypothetical protein
MKKSDLNQAINTVANLGVIAGIVFLGLEIRQANLSEQDNSHLSSLEYDVVSKEFLFRPEFAEIYNRGLAAPEALSAAEKLLFDHFVGSRINLWEYAYWADRRGTNPPNALPLWDAYFRTEMQNEGWRQNWAGRKTRQNDEFTAHVDMVLSGE